MLPQSPLTSKSVTNPRERSFPLKKRSESIRNKLLPVGAFCLILLLWWLISVTGLVPSYMLPSPVAVAQAFIKDFPNLFAHAVVSVQEAIYGLIIGIILAFIIATAMDR